MKYNVPVKDLIKSRHSCRTYDINPIDREVREQLYKEFEAVIPGFAGETIHFQLVEATEAMLLDSKVLEYGMIHNARAFLVGKISNSQMVYESYGYIMEHMVLKATELGLGSCWVGYFNLDFFQRTEGFDLGKDEIIPAIIVLGNIAGRRSLTDKIVRFVIRASKRKEWKKIFFNGNFETPLNQEEAGKFAEPLEMMRLAPSSGNSQPWLVVKEKDHDIFHFYMKVVNKIYHQRHLHNIDMGIGMSHFELSLRENNINSGKWERMEKTPVPAPEGIQYICSFR